MEPNPESLLRFACLGTAAAIFGAFVWGVRGHFASGRMRPGMAVVSLASVVAFGTYADAVIRGTPTLAALRAGSLFQLASAATFFSAVAATRERRLPLAYAATVPSFIVAAGPYRFVRHPFYASYVAFWIGCLISTQSLGVLMSIVPVITLYILAARQEEKGFLRSAFGDDYRRYRRTAGFFFPKLGHAL